MASLQGFHTAVEIYRNRPQVINRRCGGAMILHEVKNIYATESLTELVNNYCDSQACLKERLKCSPELAMLLSSLSNCPTSSSADGETEARPVGTQLNIDGHISLTVRKFVSKQTHVNFPLEIIISGESYHHFIPVEACEGNLTPVGVAYSLLTNVHAHSISVKIIGSYPKLSTTTTSAQWITNILLPAVIKWSKSGLELSNLKDNKSMKQINIDVYYEKYTAMKDTYGAAICKIWPECTDPLKFVYEDVAIACYLICLWEMERVDKDLPNKQTFVDLGCGNGLLVYILSSEGYTGYGIDVRKRKIWDLFGELADLRELSLIPSEDKLFSEADWLIGNHSDELTPWIPVMAARSSRSCQFFLLPCCPHDFYGKFQRPDSSLGIYGQYLDFVCELATKCGFHYKRDSMRIPSTRKECIIGLRQVELTTEDYNAIDSDINELISISSSSTGSATAFTPRPQTEVVRNCATVSKSVQSEIISLLTNQLLDTKNYKPKLCAADEESSQISEWNTGGILSFSATASLLHKKDLLAALKAECGGLKTLLKNHHHIFKVVAGAPEVRLADFTIDQREMTPKQLANHHKTKLCWFYESHPDGCVLSSPSCRYAHGQAELRLAPHRRS